MEVEITSEGIQAATEKINRLARGGRQLDRMNRRRADKYKELVRARAPIGETHQYVESIRVRRSGMFSRSWQVFSDAPQARRLELGFVGEDSLGRVYNQAPQEHWGPAMEEMREYDVAEANRAIQEMWDDS